MTKSNFNNLVNLLSLDSEKISRLLDISFEVKKEYKTNGPNDLLKGFTSVLFFFFFCLRTRVTFEVAMAHVGGSTINLEPGSVSLGKRETVNDAVKNLSRWVNVIIARTFKHSLVEELARNASVPVINALTDLFHPCQALAFAQTLQERCGDIRGSHVVFVGDGNNVANSLAILSGMMGLDFTLSCPSGYEIPQFVREQIQPIFQQNGCRFAIEHDPQKAVASANIIYTDVWVSMGEEAEKEKKVQHFLNFQVNDTLLSAAPAGCLVSHCLPAHRGEEITDSVLDSDISICFDEAENRLHVQKAILLALLSPKYAL
ncbi:MAG: ornithine carbamoyltransferase [Fibrobacteria bacterium]|nr:ornithine carbamoyltransferase [Fibrobacteria bacterium]